MSASTVHLILGAVLAVYFRKGTLALQLALQHTYVRVLRKDPETKQLVPQTDVLVLLLMLASSVNLTLVICSCWYQSLRFIVR